MKRRAHGFTLVELLVVMAIIAAVVAIVLPAASYARRCTYRVRELSALRQIVTAWTMYATHNGGRLLPGFKSGLPVFQADGTPIPPEATGSVNELESRYPWRLIPYLDSDFHALYVNENDAHLQELQSSDPNSFYYMTSLYPSFGLNSVWVGGDQQRYGFLPQTLPNGSVNPLSGFYATRLSGIKNPSRLTVFASSRTSATTDGTQREGYFRIESPKFLSSQPISWAPEYDPTAPPSFGNLSARGGSDVAVGTADGGVEWVALDEMRDMRRWADQATSAAWAIQAP